MNRHFRRLLSLVAVTLLLLAAVPAVAVEKVEEGQEQQQSVFMGELQGWISVFWGWVKSLGFYGGTATTDTGTGTPAVDEGDSNTDDDLCLPGMPDCEEEDSAGAFPIIPGGG